MSIIIEAQSWPNKTLWMDYSSFISKNLAKYAFISCTSIEYNPCPLNFGHLLRVQVHDNFKPWTTAKLTIVNYIFFKDILENNYS